MSRTATTIFAHTLEPRRQPPSQDSDDLFDWQQLRHYLQFSLRSIGRRPLLFCAVGCAMVVAAAVALLVLPRTYEVQAGLLVQKNPVLSVRADATTLTDPTRAAAETISSRDNLRALVVQTDLLADWPKHRAPLLRLKDWVMHKLGRDPTDKELTDGLIGLLEKNLVVWTTADGMVTIRLYWRDPVMAYRLVDAAQQNFLEKRHVLEVSTIVEQISILEGHAARLKEEVDERVADLQRVQERSTPERPRLRPRRREIGPESADVRVRLQAKRRAIADLEEFRQRRLAELQTKLIEQRAIHSENHPVVADLQRSIELSRHESPELSALRLEEAELRRQVAESPEGGASSADDVGAELLRDAYAQEDSSVEYARTQLRYAAQQYASIRDRISAARIDLDTARAAFKYRYSIVVPPEIPRGPIKPRAPFVLLAASVAGLLLALSATTLADLRSGVVFESWQIARLLLHTRPVIELQLPEGRVGGSSAAGADP